MIWFGIRFILILVVLIAAGYAIWYFNRPLPEAMQDVPLFQGVTYSRDIRQQPRPMIVHVVRIDLDAPGIGFLVTPGDHVDGHVYQARTASQFLSEQDLQLAINGDFFDPWRDYGPWDYYPHEDDPVNTRGRVASRGVMENEGYAPSHLFDTLYISAANRVSFDQPIGAMDNAISGYLMIVQEGQAAQSHLTGHDYLEQPHPRTAVALDETEQTLILIVVDGRQPNYSEGATLPELAEIVLEYGGYTALNFDGGGSSVLVMEAANGQPAQLSSPIHTRIPGRERPLANHLGVYARPLE